MKYLVETDVIYNFNSDDRGGKIEEFYTDDIGEVKKRAAELMYGGTPSKFVSNVKIYEPCDYKVEDFDGAVYREIWEKTWTNVWTNSREYLDGCMSEHVYLETDEYVNAERYYRLERYYK